MHVLILRADLHLPATQSLKAKRSVITPLIRHIDQQNGVAASEVDFSDKWQRTAVGISAVGNMVSHLEQTMDEIERYLWSRPDVEVLELTRSWWDEE
ncbi:MAG: DUF503 domain-containing protein [Actinomycetia bacterium]|nr:DUF503 domain-containing protein [Actinomycetes bacterium]MCP4225776.1 DUF503 domain-containing protein [Actinomycetes bacterium]MCP5035475.1 DUF503 domain-containing protein [Actinomycetes bacterium]